MHALENLSSDLIRIDVLVFPRMNHGFHGVSNNNDRNLSSDLVEDIVEMILGEEGVRRIARVPIRVKSATILLVLERWREWTHIRSKTEYWSLSFLIER